MHLNKIKCYDPAKKRRPLESHTSIIKCNQLTYFLLMKRVWKGRAEASLLQDSVMLVAARQVPLTGFLQTPNP